MYIRVHAEYRQACCRVMQTLRTGEKSLFCICFFVYFDVILYPLLPSNTNITRGNHVSPIHCL